MQNKLLVIIPARKGSKRLKNKNRVIFNGKELFLHSTEEAKKISGYRLRVIVSTDDVEIEKKCLLKKIEVKKRLPINGLDYAAKQSVIKDVCYLLWEEETYVPDIVLSLQANSPQVNSIILEKCLEKFKRHKEVNFCKELICINKNGDQNASIRIMTYKTVFQKTLSTYLTTFTEDIDDIHYHDDLIKVSIKMKKTHDK
tara:strand:+ start:5136 stop:5732 length:597 start_codon:yes stop_codon:yes gene_type:complete